jgi:hypothetical protein
MAVSLTGDPLNSGGFRKSTKGNLNANSGMIPLCKLCRFGIMPGEKRAWLTKPMGLSHQTCADARKVSLIKK